jgi:hypothetical protein
MGGFLSAIALAAVIVVGWLALGAQNTGYRAARLPGTDHPDLNGLWQAMNTANWDIQDHSAAISPVLAMGAWGAQPAGMGIVEGDEIPYQEWALKKRQENFANRMHVDPDDLSIGDPELKCYQPGVPRATYLPFPFQIVQGQEQVLISYEYADASRIVHMSNHAKPPVDSWMGWSNGRWEGDTLVIDVTGFNDRAWFDRAGNFHSDALHVVERYTPVDATHLQYEATIEDPKVFTRAWKISMPLYRRVESRSQRMEFKCVPFTEELLYGTLKKRTN